MFDKTGTLTKGQPEVTDIIRFGIPEATLLSITAAVETGSQHPLAQAIVREAKRKGVLQEKAEKFDTINGKGVSGLVLGEEVLAGNRVLMKDRGVPVDSETESKITLIEQEGKTAVLVAAGGRMAGVIGIADTLKDSAYQAVSSLNMMGVNVVMITGDNRRTADAIARRVGISKVIAEVLPEDKASEVQAMQGKGEIVAFVGDGINDAPALARADVGIAIGSGTDIAIESGDIVLIRDDLADSVAAIQLSKKVMGRIRGNIFWAFAYNAALIPVAAGLFYPSFGIMFRPELAAFAMALSSVTVVSLSLLLKSYVPPVERKTAPSPG